MPRPRSTTPTPRSSTACARRSSARWPAIRAPRTGSALSRISFLWGDIRATTREEKLAAYDRGRQAGRRATELAPRDAAAHFWYATNTGRWGQTNGVVRSLFLLSTVREQLAIALELDPNLTGAYVVAGYVDYEVPGLLGGDLDRAEESFRTALAQVPGFTAARVGLARTLARKGKVAEARREAQAVLDETVALESRRLDGEGHARRPATAGVPQGERVGPPRCCRRSSDRMREARPPRWHPSRSAHACSTSAPARATWPPRSPPSAGAGRARATSDRSGGRRGPYVVYDGAHLPFADGAFDTTLILLALHHCDDPEGVLDEALRVTRRRLIVMESVFRTRLDRFWLDLLDGRLNARRHGGAMNVPLAFRTLDGWRALFASRGLRVSETRWLGSWWERLVHHPALFVLDVSGAHAREITRPPPSPPGRRGRPRRGPRA